MGGGRAGGGGGAEGRGGGEGRAGRRAGAGAAGGRGGAGGPADPNAPSGSCDFWSTLYSITLASATAPSRGSAAPPQREWGQEAEVTGPRSRSQGASTQAKKPQPYGCGCANGRWRRKGRHRRDGLRQRRGPRQRRPGGPPDGPHGAPREGQKTDISSTPPQEAPRKPPRGP